MGDRVPPNVLLRRDEEGVVHLTLNRPERLNALSTELVDALATEIGRVDDATTAVVLRGSGTSFSSGHDLRDAAAEESGERGEEQLFAAVDRMQDVTRALRGCPAPVIAAVSGYAVGAGCEIALCCDLIVAADDAQFGFPETGVALIVTNAVTATLARAVGAALAKELILLGEFIPASRAYQLGLVNRVVAGDALDQAVQAWIDRLRTRGPLAVRLSKKLIDEGFAPDIEDVFARESAASVQAEKSVDAVEGVRAFAAKRRPSRTGAGV
jgi:2-(1,2-epoxy-1,2-dihydrophenyl)acetyl-CoA isomerase